MVELGVFLSQSDARLLLLDTDHAGALLGCADAEGSGVRAHIRDALSRLDERSDQASRIALIQIESCFLALVRFKY